MFGKDDKQISIIKIELNIFLATVNFASDVELFCNFD